MADISNLTNFLNDVAGAIRNTKNSTGEILPEKFDTEIKSIPEAVTQPTKTVTAAAKDVTVKPDTGYVGMAKVVITGVTSDVDENIAPENIAEGVTILGVTGEAKVLDTFDATATAGDIALNKTAYVSGKKLTGSLPEHDNGASVFGEAGVTSIVEDVSGVWVTGQTPTDRIIARNSTPLRVKINKAQLAEAIGVTADKIR